MWVFIGLLWLKKFAKAMAKALERQNGIFGTFINENNGILRKKEGERSHVACLEENEG